mgnify:CR=1 FL=1
MKAKEMFEELGYIETDLLKKPSVNYQNKDYETSISIFDNEKGRRIHIYALGDSYQDSGMIDDKDLQAIIKQCEELGWI